MSMIRRRVSSSLPRLSKFAIRSFKSLKFPGESLDSSTSPVLTHGIHVFQCPDEVGIVAKLSDCIASRGGNILVADVFVPEKKNVFYSRSEFIFDPVKWPREQMDEDFFKLSKRFNAMKSVVRVPDKDPKYKIGVLVSKQDHCLIDLLHGWQDGKLPVDITCVISNHDRLPNTHVTRFLERHGIPYHHLRTSKENKRDEEILELVQNTDFLVLARYMQVNHNKFLSNFLRAYGKDIINIHHGLLPSFKGGNPSKQAFEAGVKLIGATSHFVSEELDSGPIIEQMSKMKPTLVFRVLAKLDHENLHLLVHDVLSSHKVERVSHKDNLRSFVRKSEEVEKQCLAKAIKSYCELRVLHYEVNKTVLF
ncbi:hypothetical protein EZV62_023687 [Acer yangbiense]|uniref:ACT domain-containing protein n=1 Tax=Acer yangbiense TaxID=1000413 RepID=A0A5C7H2E3_9ROSI|nr:hypothetical protein EZV62_023687 [Acer yangbiense]